VSGEVNVDFADVRTIMACRGPALMGSGFGEGDDRAQEAAQEAISSPLLDEVSISGAQGVLINITGGMDLAIDEVSQISSIIQEEAGDEAEIIFGAVHDPTLEGKVRVTVIATGFDRSEADEEKIIRPEFSRPAKPKVTEDVQAPVQQAPRRAVAVGGSAEPIEMPLQRFPDRVITTEQIRELDIPTFIRRQMD
jgi:cell division protein FtsZ